jgi:bacterial/archaeal transporter family-2 protein
LRGGALACAASMFGYVLFMVLALITGVVFAVQTGINTQLRSFLGSPLQAVFVSFMVGTVVVALALMGKRQAPPLAKWADMPWWMWLGGLCGLFIVSTNILVAPRIGAALLTSLAIAGQLTTALVLDHYGAFGFPVHHISLPRIAGAALLLAGVLLIRYN